MKRLLLLACLGLPVSLLAEGGLPSQPYIYVEGKAEIEKPADMVTLRFDLVARNADQSKANQEVQAKAAKILALLDERKIAQDDVIAADLKSEPQYDDDEKRSKIVAYGVTRSFQVKIRDITVFPKLVDEFLGIGGVEFSSITSGLSNEKEMQNDVWQAALTDARERAEKTLKPIGMKIDSIFGVSPVAFPEIRQKMFGAGELVTASYAAQGPGERQLPQYRLAPVTISQSVHLIYLISPVK